MKRLSMCLLTMLLGLLALPGMAAPKFATWTARLAAADIRAGEGTQILVSIKVDAPWHVYSLTTPDGGPLKTTIELVADGPLVRAGKAIQPKPKVEFEKVFNVNVESFEGTVNFAIPVKVKKGVSGIQTAKLKVRYQLCGNGTCLPPKKEEVLIKFAVTKGTPRPNRLKPVTTPPSTRAQNPFAPYGATLMLAGGPNDTPPSSSDSSVSPPANGSSTGGTTQEVQEAQAHGLLPFLWLSFGAGLLSLLTPCVFPMIPITVSYFIKRKSGQKGGGVPGAVVYSLGIVSTFMALGLGATLFLGPQIVSKFGTNPWINIGFAILFIILGLNLLGVYEIAVPSGLANKMNSEGAKRGGYMQPFLMGFAFALTTFTCTAPYVGTLLLAASRGSFLYPALGMLAFSTAFALPFFLLALFPNVLAAMPKSGSWLVTVKAYMGLLELAAALKFLSNADLVWQKGLLTREIFLSIWVVIAVIAGMYLLGWLLLPNDIDAKIGWTRRGIGIGTLGIAIYLLAAMRGAPLGIFEAFPPPKLYPGQEFNVTVKASSGMPKTAPLVWMNDYNAALAKAKAENKFIFIDFTGYTCVNCREMEVNVFAKPETEAEFREFVLLRLYTDDLKNAEAEKRSEENQKIQEKLSNTIALPTYVTLSPEGKVVKVLSGKQPLDVFVRFLKESRGGTGVENTRLGGVPQSGYRTYPST